MKEEKNLRDKGAVVTSVGFIGLLVFLMLLCMAIPDKEFSDQENRNLQKFPELYGESIADGAFMKNFEVYASDHVAARDEWVKLKNTGDWLSGKKDNGKAYWGKDGYLFPIEEIDKRQLSKNLSYVSEFIDKITSQYAGMNVTVAVVPTAPEILKEKLPLYAQLPEQQEVLRKTSETFGSTYLDLTEMLKSHADEYIYYKTDHHWTTLGAYYGYRAWAEKEGFAPVDKTEMNIETVSSEFYGTTASKISGFRMQPDDIHKFTNDNTQELGMKIESKGEQRKRESIFDADYLNAKDKYSYFLSGNNAKTIVEGSAQNRRNMLLIKDSYGNCFVPFLTEHFENIYVIDLRYHKEGLMELIEKENITDVMFMYNAIQFANDRNLVFLKANEGKNETRGNKK